MEKRIPVEKSFQAKSKCGLYTVTLLPKCFQRMLKQSQNAYPNEIGSSLMGHYSEDGFEAFVEDIAPCPSDSLFGPTRFCRGVKGIVQFFQKFNRKYHGKKFYVGEWHSHPNMSPHPSHLDDETQLTIAHDIQANCRECILIIIGGNPFTSPEFEMFVYSRKFGKIRLYKIEEKGLC